MTNGLLTMHPIAYMHCDLPDKFGLPRQSGLCEALEGRVVMEPAYRAAEAFRALESYDHLWLIWWFDRMNGSQAFSPTVRPPKLGGNTRVGVFASRSPNRPNPIGLSCVRLLKVEYGTAVSPVLHVSGIDLADGTPILDIKPYIPYTDCRPEALGGYAQPEETLTAELPQQFEQLLPSEKREGLLQLLKQDPRPGYQHEEGRSYTLRYAGCEVTFEVHGTAAVVTRIVPDQP